MAKIWLFIYTPNSLMLLSKSNILTLIRKKSDLRHSPDTIVLDREIVFIHLDSEEPSLTPVGSPAVSSNPVLCPCFCISAPTNHRYDMIDSMIPSLAIDSGCVFQKLSGDSDSTGNGAPLPNLLFHCCSTPDWSPFLSKVASEVLNCKTV